MFACSVAFSIVSPATRGREGVKLSNKERINEASRQNRKLLLLLLQQQQHRMVHLIFHFVLLFRYTPRPLLSFDLFFRSLGSLSLCVSIYHVTILPLVVFLKNSTFIWGFNLKIYRFIMVISHPVFLASPEFVALLLEL